MCRGVQFKFLRPKTQSLQFLSDSYKTEKIIDIIIYCNKNRMLESISLQTKSFDVKNTKDKILKSYFSSDISKTENEQEQYMNKYIFTLNIFAFCNV